MTVIPSQGDRYLLPSGKNITIERRQPGDTFSCRYIKVDGARLSRSPVTLRLDFLLKYARKLP